VAETGSVSVKEVAAAAGVSRQLVYSTNATAPGC
jgi:hypothetical protein